MSVSIPFCRVLSVRLRSGWANGGLSGSAVFGGSLGPLFRTEIRIIAMLCHALFPHSPSAALSCCLSQSYGPMSPHIVRFVMRRSTCGPFSLFLGAPMGDVLSCLLCCSSSAVSRSFPVACLGWALSRVRLMRGFPFPSSVSLCPSAASLPPSLPFYLLKIQK